MRRAIPALTLVLLTAACSTTTAHTTASTAATAPSTTAPEATSATPAALPSPTGTATGTLMVAMPAQQLPYKPAPGAPALGDVSIVKTAADPCGIPADDSGNEGQLLDAELDGNVLIVTFEFTNPCTRPLAYNIDVTQAIGSATGKPGGPPLRTTTQPIQPGGSDTLKVNVDPDPSLTPAQLRQLWVGVTHITKGPAY